MRHILCCVTFILAATAALRAQSPAFSIAACIDKLPAVAASASAAHGMYAPKGKKNVHQLYEADIQAQVNLLAKQANHKSSLLSMLAKSYGKDSERYDLSKVQLAKDKLFDKKVQAANTDFFAVWDSWQRTINDQLDVLRKKETTGILTGDAALQVYREQVPQLIKKVKLQLVALDDLMTSKGYNAILDKMDAGHPYYIQLLEVRGIMFDRLLKLNQLIDGVNKSAALQ